MKISLLFFVPTLVCSVKISLTHHALAAKIDCQARQQHQKFITSNYYIITELVALLISPLRCLVQRIRGLNGLVRWCIPIILLNE
ncbi:MAG: hypothetical protein DRR16_24445 [Candidatus Parabeggiatoa sp. nov. 3]|nr:MAG: hypothetical protein DRR00_29305 [Gammaproteobacteria bacterium]RKZ60155.1 MAG: hypothetical protein DRQ99_22535 [Gammaproteobacteria bacterium]RKZ80119.1 MAG: hypothetical protein DRR16_24445 [Gammaproteobacteria bacterium]HEW97218.1 hypothetical protein [Beggiatoa sp.]